MSNPEISSKGLKAVINVRVSGPGKNGYTPQRGKDYWTKEDKQEIQDYVDEQVGEATSKIAKPWLVGATDEITPAQVLAALKGQRNVVLVHVNDDTGPVSFTGFVAMPDGNAVLASAAVSLEGETGIIQLVGDIERNSWSFGVETMITNTDTSLSVQGAAADARFVGQNLTYAASNIPVMKMVDGYMDSDGNVLPAEGYVCKYTPLVKVVPGESIYYKGFSDKGISVAWVNADSVTIGTAAYKSIELEDGDYLSIETIVPEEAVYAIFASTRAMPDADNPSEVPFNVYRGGDRVGEVTRVDGKADRLAKEIKAVSGNGLIKTAIIKSDHYEDLVECLRAYVDGATTPIPEELRETTLGSDTLRCINMTYEEARGHLLAGGVLEIVLMAYGDSFTPFIERSVQIYHSFPENVNSDAPNYIRAWFFYKINNINVELLWTENGIEVLI